jgi:tRNA(Ile)-lysidine synthase
MSTLVEAVRRFLTRHRIGPCHILAAVSGGPDSTALLLALEALRGDGYTVSAGHVNHSLRGAESDADEAFLRGLTSQIGVDLQALRAEPDPAAIAHRGLEAAARDVRYRTLALMRTLAGADWVATAHTRNDQAETLLMRLITGSGLQRLQGIRPVTGDGVIRPLLDVYRSDVEAYLVSRGISGRVDSTNRESRFLRNRIRAEILPALAALNPRIVDTLAETADLVRTEREVVEPLVAERERHWVFESDDLSRFEISKMPAERWLIARALHRQIRRLDPTEREVSSTDLRRLAREMSTLRRTTVSGSMELSREGDSVFLRRKSPAPGEFERSISPGETIELEQIGARITLRAALENPFPAGESSRRQEFQLPSAEGAFRIRNRRKGDRFQPLGMDQSKSLSDFLIDRKVPRSERDRIPLLLWNEEIVWVGGVEVSERFKVTDSGRQILAAVIEWR